MPAVVIRPDTHVLHWQAKYGFVLAEQLYNSASGAGSVKADCRRGRCGARSQQSAPVSLDAKQATSSRQDDSMTTRDRLRTPGAQQGVLGPEATHAASSGTTSSSGQPAGRAAAGAGGRSGDRGHRPGTSCGGRRPGLWHRRQRSSDGGLGVKRIGLQRNGTPARARLALERTRRCLHLGGPGDCRLQPAAPDDDQPMAAPRRRTPDDHRSPSR
jgi:hypothetical protein